MQVSPYLSFKGDCEEAFKFYERALGAKIECMMPNEGSPMEEHTPPEWRKKILHGAILIGGQRVMGSDVPPNEYKKPEAISLTLSLSDVEQADRLYKELSEGGSVQMEIQETFWAKRSAMLVDRFGIPWMINCEKPMP